MAGKRFDEALRWMESRIHDGTWPLNTQIPTEAELTAALGVGRSTVREATRTLANSGMLESAAGRGTFVRARSAVNTVLSDYLKQQPLHEVLVLRRALEGEAAALAALARTDEQLARMSRPPAGSGDPLPESIPSPGNFHADLFAAAGSPMLTELYQCAIASIRRAQLLGRLVAAPAADREADHRRILEAVRAGDAHAARQAASEHCDRDFTVR
ncbi:FadR family transcriptional regulator [Kineosporia sp. J2-2]|uniref:FadR family transcriptional regulator n=1 Tax=Kineosporia corallincola TaxID=2835133 RepID=A0ABS5TES5_9ACTN|nr:GntR family transcriptional regulator [Kineosporia corallincola]MBT0769576.1 FadR family transcriptional regulator [Kineosporia corallincola]